VTDIQTKHNADEKQQIAFVSLGCSKNLVDTELMMGQATTLGWEIVAELEEAEIIVVNTCAFIEPAKEESIETILEIAELKESGKLKTLVMAGCLAQRYAKEMQEELSEVDVFIGTGELEKIKNVINGTANRVELGKQSFLAKAETPRVLATPYYTANLKISEGCSNTCAFCVIPKIRGFQKSRSLNDIIAETGKLLKDGVRELCIIGQNVSAYGDDLENSDNLVKLLQQPELVEGDHWVRLHYLYPNRVTKEVIQAMVDAPAVLPYVDIPIQHIDSQMLKTMRRKDDEKSTRLAIDTIRQIMPDAVLRTSLVVGFPGETEQQFQKLYDFVAEGHFEHLGVFTYSREEGTIAYSLKDQVEEQIKQERMDALMQLQQEISEERLERFLGKTISVLVEGQSEEHELLTSGRAFSQAAEIDGVTYITDGEVKPGEIQQVEIISTHVHDMEGIIV